MTYMETTEQKLLDTVDAECRAWSRALQHALDGMAGPQHSGDDESIVYAENHWRDFLTPSEKQMLGED